MTTSARYYALRWFADHEALGPDEMLTRRPPTARMRKLMLAEGHLTTVPLNQFNHHNWRLTPQGHAVLKAKSKRVIRRRSWPREHKNRNDLR